jgi:hypothetical protein
MEPATEGIAWLQIVGIIGVILAIGAGGVWIRHWLRQREVDRRGPGDPKDQKKAPR